MRVLVVGSGGREHALVWKLRQSAQVTDLYAAPGNPGMERDARCVRIGPEDIRALADFAGKESIDLTVVGPEAPLAAGIVDEFAGRGLRIFGPSREAARLESSKVFAKEVTVRCGVPAAEGKIFDEPEAARQEVKRRGAPVVVKADGLAAGKGVTVARTVGEALAAIDAMMVEKVFGGAGTRIIVEECLEGEEASVLAFTDGRSVLPMLPSQDHKRIYDGDNGPNTGGMGAYAPAPVLSAGAAERVRKEVLVPVVRAMAAEGHPYVGVLYAGVIMTAGGPKVLEFNARFGDPETQATLPLLETDILIPMLACLDGTLGDVKLQWMDGSCVCVVVASGGYPGKYDQGKPIDGLDEFGGRDGTVVFHAGTVRDSEGRVVTSGGRVLGVTAVGSHIVDAIERAYEAVGRIQFEGMYYRRDIGRKAIAYAAKEACGRCRS